jgi:hypothetical protein
MATYNDQRDEKDQDVIERHKQQRRCAHARSLARRLNFANRDAKYGGRKEAEGDEIGDMNLVSARCV